MDLDTMLAKAAPARHASLDGPDSPAAIGMYQRITAAPGPPATGVRRHRLSSLRLAGVAAVGAAAAVAVGLTVIPGSATPAWAVTKRPDGLVVVTINQLRDPAGLARRLRADGVPAHVRFLKRPFTPTTSSSAIPRACRAPHMSDEANAKLQVKIMPIPFDRLRKTFGPRAVLAIRPAAIPHRIGLYLKAFVEPGTYGEFGLQSDLVLATARCTGS